MAFVGARKKGGNAISHFSLDNWLGSWKVFERLHRICGNGLTRPALPRPS
jgi:hypothetical protein